MIALPLWCVRTKGIKGRTTGGVLVLAAFAVYTVLTQYPRVDANTKGAFPGMILLKSFLHCEIG
jgi:hypothetical protein